MASLLPRLTRKRALFVQKWSGFVSTIWVSVFSGCYVFPNYSSALKEVLAINQKLLNNLSVARVVGDSGFGLLAGILSNYVPPGALFCSSAMAGFVGYSVDWLVVSRTIDPLPYWVMFISETLSGSSVSWTNVAVLNASVRNFRQNRGPVSGLFKAYMGLSAAIFVIICKTLFSNAASTYLIMLVIIPTLFCIVSAIIFKPVSSAETQEEVQAERTSLHIFNAMACGLAVYIAILDFLPSALKERCVYKLVAIPVLMAFLGAPALVPLMLFSKVKETSDDLLENGAEVVSSLPELEAGVDEEKSSTSLILDGNNCPLPDKSEKDGTLHQPLLDSTTDIPPPAGTSSWSFWKVEGLGEEIRTLSLLKSWHYYVLYFSLFCGCGSTMTFSNNLGQIAQSIGFDDPSLFASLFSLGSFFGRLALGNISEYSLRIAGIPRPAWLGLMKVPMILVLWWLSGGSAASLYVGSPMLGFGLGCVITLTVPIVSEFYGLKHFGPTVSLTNSIFLTGTYSFSALAGYLYDRAAMAGGEENGSSLVCDGAECFGSTFHVMAYCLIVGLVCDMVLTIISRPLYQKLKVLNSNFAEKSKTTFSST